MRIKREALEAERKAKEKEAADKAPAGKGKKDAKKAAAGKKKWLLFDFNSYICPYFTYNIRFNPSFLNLIS